MQTLREQLSMAKQTGFPPNVLNLLEDQLAAAQLEAAAARPLGQRIDAARGQLRKATEKHEAAKLRLERSLEEVSAAKAAVT